LRGIESTEVLCALLHCYIECERDIKRSNSSFVSSINVHAVESQRPGDGVGVKRLGVIVSESDIR